MRRASNVCSYIRAERSRNALERRPLGLGTRCAGNSSRTNADRRDHRFLRPAPRARLPRTAALPLLPGGRGPSTADRAENLREGAWEARQLAAKAVLEIAQGRQEERVEGQGRSREIAPLRVGGTDTLPRMAKREPTTEELRRAQRERITEEHEAIPNSITPDEELQHRRRAEKSAYLERMLAVRERSERERDRD